MTGDFMYQVFWLNRQTKKIKSLVVSILLKIM